MSSALVLCQKNYNNISLVRAACDEFFDSSRSSPHAIICENNQSSPVWKYAEERDIPILSFPSEDINYGNSERQTRERKMVSCANVLIVFRKKNSDFANSIIQLAQEKSVPTHFVFV